MITVLPRVSAVCLSAVMGSAVYPLKSKQRRQLLSAVNDMQRSVWLLNCNLKQADQLALLESLESNADEIDQLLT